MPEWEEFTSMSPELVEFLTTGEDRRIDRIDSIIEQLMECVPPRHEQHVLVWPNDYPPHICLKIPGHHPIKLQVVRGEVMCKRYDTRWWQPVFILEDLIADSVKDNTDHVQPV